jgi:anti-sigma factor RsiW
MKQCGNEGNLRAFLDGELEPEEMAALTSHLRDCAECEELHRELAGRAAFVSVLMGELRVEAPRVVEFQPARKLVRWGRWAGVAAVVAAGFLIGILTLPKRPAPAPVAARLPVVREVPAAVESPIREPVRVASAPAPVRVARAATKRGAAAPKIPQLSLDGFVTLDDEPFEAGLLVRVTLGPEQVPADVVFSADGRARAYRLVNERSN